MQWECQGPNTCDGAWGFVQTRHVLHIWCLCSLFALVFWDVGCRGRPVISQNHLQFIYSLMYPLLFTQSLAVDFQVYKVQSILSPMFPQLLSIVVYCYTDTFSLHPRWPMAPHPCPFLLLASSLPFFLFPRIFVSEIWTQLQYLGYERSVHRDLQCPPLPPASKNNIQQRQCKTTGGAPSCSLAPYSCSQSSMCACSSDTHGYHVGPAAQKP